LTNHDTSNQFDQTHKSWYFENIIQDLTSSQHLELYQYQIIENLIDNLASFHFNEIGLEDECDLSLNLMIQFLFFNIDSGIFTRLESYFRLSIDSCACESWTWITNRATSHSINGIWIWTSILWFGPNPWTNFGYRTFLGFESNLRVSIGSYTFRSWARTNSHTIIG